MEKGAHSCKGVEKVYQKKEKETAKRNMEVLFSKLHETFQQRSGPGRQFPSHQ